MLSEEKAIEKLRMLGGRFNEAVRKRHWGVANRTYLTALTVANFLELPEEVHKELWGDWDSEEADGSAKDNGLFARSDLARVNKECCILRHKAYEDQICNQKGERPRYYSDADYCATCTKAKK